MDSVYIKKDDVNKWIGKYFKKDLISVDDLISVIEDLDDRVWYLEDEIEKLQSPPEEDYKDEERGRELGVKF